MITVRDLLTNKGTTIFSITPETPTIEAVHLLNEKNVGALVVLDEGLLTGIVSERDFVHQVAADRNFGLDTPVSEYMTTRIYTVSPEMSVEECMQLMTGRRIRHLPVLEAGRLVGLISIGDVVKSLLSEQSTKIHNLEEYLYHYR